MTPRRWFVQLVLRERTLLDIWVCRVAVQVILERRKNARSGVSSSEGPGMSEYSAYYCQYMDARYIPQALHAVNHLACTIFHNSVVFFKWAKMLCISKERYVCQIAVRTQNYCVSSHCDKPDKQTAADNKLVLFELITNQVVHQVT